MTWISKYGAAAIALALSLIAGAAQAQQCVIYKGEDYRGDRFGFRDGQAILRFNSFNDRVSSVKVADGCRLVAFEGYDGRGRRLAIERNVKRLAGDWDNTISGAICECGYANQRQRREDMGACVIYEDRGFRGEQYAFKRDDEALRFSRYWNDRVSSVRVAPGCRLIAFENRNGLGAERVFRDDTEWLGNDWNDRISGAICRCGRAEGRQAERYDGPPPLRRRGAGCVAYERRNYGAAKGQAWQYIRPGRDFEPLERGLRGGMSSIRVAPGCRAILDVGQPYTVGTDQDIPRLRYIEDRVQAVSCRCN